MAEWTKDQVVARITAEAQRQGVDPKLALAVATQESSLNPTKVGDNGNSLGLFQLQRAAAIDAGIDPARRGEPEENIRGGVTYLKQKLQQSGGNVDQALSRYNRGSPTYQGIGDPNYERNVKQYYDIDVRLGGQTGGAARPSPTAPLPPAEPVPPSFLERVGGWFSPAAAEADDLSSPYVQRKTAESRQERRRLAGMEDPSAPSALLPAPPISPAATQLDETQAWFDQPVQPPDILRKAGAYGVQVLGGARDAFVETMQTINSMGDWMRAHGIGPQWEAQVTIPEVRQAEGLDEEAVRSISQFVTAFIPGARLVKGLGVAGRVTQSMLAGALSDFAAFDPDSPRLSDLYQQLPAAIQNPLTDFLAHDPDDSEAMSRLKNALEGLGLGAVTDALLLAARTMGKARALKRAVDIPPGSGTPPPATALGELTDEEITAAVEAERSAGETAKAQRVQQTQTALEAVKSGDDEVIRRELTQAKALVGDDGRVVMGAGQTLRHFDTPQEAAQHLVERRLERQQAATTAHPMGAVRRAMAARQVPQTQVREGYGTATPGPPIRVYHGTPADFPTFRPEAGRPTQYGSPTYWFAEDPEVAGGQRQAIETGMEERAGLPAQPLTAAQVAAREEALTAELDAARAQWQQGSMTDVAYGAEVQRVQQAVEELRSGLSEEDFPVSALTGYAQGGVVRPTYLDIRQPFDMSQPLDATSRQRLDAALAQQPEAIRQGAHQALAAGKSGRAVFEALVDAFAGGKAPTQADQNAARQVLEAAGFDGIFHVSPEDGRVWVAFRPEQIIPAYTEAGQQMGGAIDRLAPAEVQQAQQLLSLEASGVAGALPTEGRAYYVNFDRLNRPEDVRQTIATVAEIVKEQVEAQRRGVQTTEETLAKARQSPYQRLDTILGIEPGTVLNAEDATALRSTWLASADRLTELIHQVAAGDLAASEAFLKQMVITAGIHTRAVGVTGEMGRAFRMLGVEMPQTSRQFLDDFLQIVTQQTGLTPQQIAQKLQVLPSREALAKFLRDAERASGADMFTELWYGALLSNPTTLVVNALDSAMRTVWAVPERLLAAGMGGMQLDETTHLLYGMKAGWQEAWSAARQMWDTGVSRFGAAGKIDVPFLPSVTARNLNLGQGTILGDAVDLLGETTRLFGRVLMTTDEWFKTINYRMELHAQSFRQAVHEGTTDEGLSARILALVDDPPPALHERARQFANQQTLAQPLDEAGGAFESLGRMTQHVMNAREEWLPMKLLLPFVRTPFNIARSAMERTPLGLASTNVRQALAQGGPDGALARSKMTLGTLTMALGGYLAWEGTITGRKPHDKAVAETWDRLGIQEYSVKIGDQYLSYNRLEWPGFVFGLAADFATLAKTLPSSTLEGLAGAGVTAFFDNLTSKTYVKAIGEFLDAMSPGSRYEDEVATGRDFRRFAQQRLSSLIPSGVALTARLMDPVKREVRSMYDQMLSRLPGFSEELPPSRDLWGRVRTHPEAFGPDMLSPFMTRQYRPDAVDNELLRLKVPLGMPTRVWKLPDVPGLPEDAMELTPKQYDRFVVLSAGEGGASMPPLKETLRQLIDAPGYQQLSDGPQGGKAVMIRNTVNSYREAAKAQLQQEDPEVAALFRTHELGRKLSQTQQGVQTFQQMQSGGAGIGIGR